MEDVKNLCLSMMTQIQEQKREINEKDQEIRRIKNLHMKMKDEKYKTELAKIEDENLKSIAKDILDEHTHLSFENGRFVFFIYYRV